MNISEESLTKLYYTIGEVAEMFEVNTSLIRFWEKEFDVIKPKKNKKGNRLFSPKDIKNLNRIYHLVKIKGFTLDGAKKSIKSTLKIPAPTSNNHENVIKSLEDIKKKLLALKKKPI